MTREPHRSNSDLVKDIIIGMSVVSGLAEIAAGCISMGLGGYLGGESEVEHYDSELKREFSEIETVPETELKEVQDILIG